MTQTQPPPSRQDPTAQRWPRIAPIMPFGYLAGLVRWLWKARDCKVISYADMTLAPAMDQSALDAEFGTWHQGHRGDKLRYILLQYDVDARADATMELLEVHIRTGVPACAMVFNERIFDRVLREEGRVVRDRDYRLDFDLLREFQSAGGQVGYHCNTWERGMFDLAKAKELFKRDVDELRKEVDIQYFSMHGGPLDAKGRSNAHMEVDDLAAELGRYQTPSQLGVTRLAIDWLNADQDLETLCRVACLDAAGPRFDPVGLAEMLASTWVTVPEEARAALDAYQGHLIWFNEMREQFSAAETGNSGRLFGWLSRPARRDDADRCKQRWFADAYWNDKAEKNKQAPADVLQGLSSLADDTGPVFINGMSRSGTTLLAGLFDVREDVAMSYELYPNYLVGHGEEADHYVDFSQVAFLLRNADENEAFNLLAEMGEPKISSFVPFLRDLLRRDWIAIQNKIAVDDLGPVLSFVGKLGDPDRGGLSLQEFNRRQAMYRQAEIQAMQDVPAFLDKARHIYGYSHFVNDVGGSLCELDEPSDPGQLGKNWTARAANFERFLERSGATGAIVKYEDLAREPEKALETLCSQIGLPFSDQMLRHHEHDISLLHKPRGQLSAARVAKPIDESAIGRWRQDLSKDQLQAFMETAGEAVERWGYLSSQGTTG